MYARYKTFYLETLKNVQKNYPRLKELMRSTGMSAQGQDRYAHRTAIDQRGKKTINRNAKYKNMAILQLLHRLLSCIVL